MIARIRRPACGQSHTPSHLGLIPGLAGQATRSSGPRPSLLASGTASLQDQPKDRPSRGRTLWAGRTSCAAQVALKAQSQICQPSKSEESLSAASPPEALPYARWAIGALASGAAAIGALAIGAVAVGRLRVGNAAAKKLSVGRLEVDELVIGGKPVRAEDFGPVIGSA